MISQRFDFWRMIAAIGRLKSVFLPKCISNEKSWNFARRFAHKPVEWQGPP